MKFKNVKIGQRVTVKFTDHHGVVLDKEDKSYDGWCKVRVHLDSGGNYWYNHTELKSKKV